MLSNNNVDYGFNVKRKDEERKVALFVFRAGKFVCLKFFFVVMVAGTDLPFGSVSGSQKTVLPTVLQTLPCSGALRKTQYGGCH